MRKRLALLLTALTVFGSLAGCGGQTTSESSGAGSSGASVQSESTTASVAAESPAMETGMEDGSYTAEFETDSTMFHLNETCEGKVTLTVADGQMTAHVLLASTGIVNLYVGTSEEAQAEGAERISYTEEEVDYGDGDIDTAYAFELPVPVIGEAFSVAILGTKGKWYDHTVTVTDPVKN